MSKKQGIDTSIEKLGVRILKPKEIEIIPPPKEETKKNIKNTSYA